jgi:hypothetical protein
VEDKRYFLFKHLLNVGQKSAIRGIHRFLSMLWNIRKGCGLDLKPGAGKVGSSHIGLFEIGPIEILRSIL